MSVSFYLILHVMAVLVMASGLGALCFSAEKSKAANIFFGISSLVVFVAGFGLLHKMHIPFQTPWVLSKFAIWVLVAATAPLIVKRAPHLKKTAFIVLMGLLLAAVYVVFTKAGI
ncbi:MAG: hypothetical protein AB7F28_07585 [Candidatus Margulisiibacteriota bacterium]